MYSYLSVTQGESPFIDNYLIPKIKKLLYKYNRFLEDDYSAGCFEKFLTNIHPHLYAGFKDEEFMGFVYLSDWKGGRKKFHSCTLTVCIEKKFWGKSAREASRMFIKKVFKHYGLYKLKALVFEHNKNVRNFLLSLGFLNEALLKGETFKNGKPVNMFVYSLFNYDVLS